MTDMRDSAAGAILGALCGDAVGATLEFSRGSPSAARVEEAIDDARLAHSNPTGQASSAVYCIAVLHLVLHPGDGVGAFAAARDVASSSATKRSGRVWSSRGPVKTSAIRPNERRCLRRRRLPGTATPAWLQPRELLTELVAAIAADDEAMHAS